MANKHQIYIGKYEANQVRDNEKNVHKRVLILFNDALMITKPKSNKLIFRYLFKLGHFYYLSMENDIDGKSGMISRT